MGTGGLVSWGGRDCGFLGENGGREGGRVEIGGVCVEGEVMSDEMRRSERE